MKNINKNLSLAISFLAFSLLFILPGNATAYNGYGYESSAVSYAPNPYIPNNYAPLQAPVYNPPTSTVVSATTPAYYPSPVINSISPDQAPAGSLTQTISITGANFRSNSVARWNGADRQTTYISKTRLDMILPASDLTTVGTYPITVYNPINSATSNKANFTVTKSFTSTATTNTDDSNLSGNALFAFLPGTLLGWLFLAFLILLLVLLVKSFYKKEEREESSELAHA